MTINAPSGMRVSDLMAALLAYPPDTMVSIEVCGPGFGMYTRYVEHADPSYESPDGRESDDYARDYDWVTVFCLLATMEDKNLSAPTAPSAAQNAPQEQS